jgi:hypothetical protein
MRKAMVMGVIKIMEKKELTSAKLTKTRTKKKQNMWR